MRKVVNDNKMQNKNQYLSTGIAEPTSFFLDNMHGMVVQYMLVMLLQKRGILVQRPGEATQYFFINENKQHKQKYT